MYPVAVATVPTVKVNAVVVPTYLLILVIAVVVTPSVKDKSTGAVGNALVKDNVLAALKQPLSFTERTAKLPIVPAPAATFKKFTTKVLVP